MKLNKKYETIIFTFFMAFGMSCLMSFVMMSINYGFHDSFLMIWMRSWGIAFLLAFPVAYFLPKGIRRVMKRIQFVEYTRDTPQSTELK
ncbi:DUF2798 domain-containing protein [Paenibacillus urinalis]|uniref:DUF2798 domain-containing protein n=1 Tax=Paenibacillus urinalis TaxID=521520 RepID=A0AAX3N7V3_9BACL|nr:MULTISPECIES: DUF2798 domain-containing protein [Paenibacillus]WDH84840.1 DUF2798 domain-containing protein [Paenibacillus urinalis]WDH96299.1 DUF2798 domain-containing protein [Paenibacillus urinalis]WDI04522.1 DUF2798 domain-containing protein [Paenibacillus urinalis]GAK42750.1 hypothetical protein TCA2_5243 [Paenibacillus sp. TCA20]